MDFINPSQLATTPAASPSASSSSSSASGSRKRPRTELSSQEKREARAERNRIAAQISRDRRKEEFGHLKVEVDELRKENAALRAALASQSSGATVASIISTPAIEIPATPSERESERERENQELKERVRVLEKAWENVVGALQGIASGTTPLLPSAFSIPMSPTTPSSSPSPTSPASAPATTINSTASPQPSPSLVLTPEQSTRHLARVATALSPSLDDEASATDPTVCTITPTNIIPMFQNDEEWLRAVIDASSTSPAPTDISTFISTPMVETSTFDALSSSTALTNTSSLFGHAEMERLLALLPAPESHVSLDDLEMTSLDGKNDWMSSWLREETAGSI